MHIYLLTQLRHIGTNTHTRVAHMRTPLACSTKTHYTHYSCSMNRTQYLTHTHTLLLFHDSYTHPSTYTSSPTHAGLRFGQNSEYYPFSTEAYDMANISAPDRAVVSDDEYRNSMIFASFNLIFLTLTFLVGAKFIEVWRARWALDIDVIRNIQVYCGCICMWMYVSNARTHGCVCFTCLCPSCIIVPTPLDVLR